MRAIFKSSLYKYFRSHFTDNRLHSGIVCTPGNMLENTRKSRRKRYAYYHYVNIMTMRLYWMTKIALCYPDSFEELELPIVVNTLISMHRGATYASIPYSKELYNKIRKVVHDAMQGKFSKSPIKPPIVKFSQLKYVYKEIPNILEEPF